MKKLQLKMDMVRSIGKQSGEYVESVLKKKKMKATLWEGFAAEKVGFNLLAVKEWWMMRVQVVIHLLVLVSGA